MGLICCTFAINYFDCFFFSHPVTEPEKDVLKQEHCKLPLNPGSQHELIVSTNTETALEYIQLIPYQINSYTSEEDTKEEHLLVADYLRQRKRLVSRGHSLDKLPSFCILPPKPSHDIAGRDCEVAEILQQLKDLKSANESRLSFLYMSGNTGSGKSQLASLVAQRFFDEDKKIARGASFVMTVNAESPDTLLESYFSLARQLKSPEYAVTNLRNSDLTTDEKMTGLMALISTKIKLYTSWLIVVDNVSSISPTNVHLLEAGNERWARGQFLITTQDTQSIPLSNSFTRHISVSKGMESREASSLLALLSGITDDREMENEVALVLDFQPLALASAAIYVREVRQNKLTSNFGWKDYVKKLEKDQRGTTETILTETNPIYPNSMTAATKIAVEKVMSFDKVIQHTCSFLSLCTPQPLRLDIVINYILNVDKEIKDEETISMRIRKCPLLLFEEGDSGVYIREHQVVHDVINSVIKDCQGNKLLEALNGAFNTLGTVHLDLAVRLKKFGSEHVDVATVYHNLGAIYQGLSDLEQAKEYYGCALAIRLKTLGPEHVDVSTSYNNLGAVYEDLGDLEQAKECYHHVLAIGLKTLGPEHVDVSTSYNNLGAVYEDLGDLEQAKECYHRALAIGLKTLGPEHADVSTSYNNLGAVYKRLGDLEQAKECYHHALTIGLKSLGPEHADVSTSYNNLGAVYKRLGDLEQAKECYHHALNIGLKSLGPEHADVSTSYNNLGAVYKRLGDLEQAKECYHHALAIGLKTLGPEHADVSTSYNNLGAVYKRLGDLEQAKECYHHALTIGLKSLGPEHVDVSTSYNNLGAVYKRLGDLEQAKECYHHALAIGLKTLGPEHADVSTSYNNLGVVYEDLGDLEQAKECYHHALAIGLKTLGPEHADVSTSYNNLGAVYKRLGDLEQAKECYHHALTIGLKTLGPEHADVSTSYNNLGAVYKRLGDLEQAKECYHHALAIGLKTLGPEHADVSTSYNNPGAVYKRLGDLEQAIECYHRTLTIGLKDCWNPGQQLVKKSNQCFTGIS